MITWYILFYFSILKITVPLFSGFSVYFAKIADFLILLLLAPWTVMCLFFFFFFLSAFKVFFLSLVFQKCYQDLPSGFLYIYPFLGFWALLDLIVLISFGNFFFITSVSFCSALSALDQILITKKIITYSKTHIRGIMWILSTNFPSCL